MTVVKSRMLIQLRSLLHEKIVPCVVLRTDGRRFSYLDLQGAHCISFSWRFC